MYVCMYIYILYIYIHTYTYIHIYTCMHCIYIYVCTRYTLHVYRESSYGERTPDFAISCYLVLLSSIVTRIFF